MNKRSIRAFAFGILFSVCLFGTVYFSAEDNRASKLNTEEAKAHLEKNGYVALSKAQYEELEKTIAKQLQPEEKQQENKREEPSTFKLEIVKGMNSRDIALLLEHEKIIADANKFEMYLMDNAYSKRIQLGIFKVNSEMTNQEIAKMITKS